MRSKEAREERARKCEQRARALAAERALKKERRDERRRDEDAWALQRPSRRKWRREHGAVSGLASLALIIIVATVISLAVWAAAVDVSTRAVSDAAGLAVAIGLAAFFFFLARGPSLVDAVPAIRRVLASAEKAAKPLSGPFSWIDELLVDRIAVVAGSTLWRAWERYAVLALHLTAAGIAGYLAPAPWGLIPLAWGFLVTLAVARRWSWVEDDLSAAMQTLNYDRWSNKELQIGFGQDLRDEALTAFLFFLFFIPMALRQANGGGESGAFFEYNGDGAISFVSWIAYFGAELAKAVPFVDWAEVYNVGNGASIAPIDGSGGNHVVFAMRAVVDLVLLTALVQGLQVSHRVSTQEIRFEEGRIDLLDPFLERKLFYQLARGFDAKTFEPIKGESSLPRYNASRLEYLVSTRNSGGVQMVALAILCRHRPMGWEGIVVERLKDLNHRFGDVRENAVKWLAEIRGADTLDVLLRIVEGDNIAGKDPKGSVRLAAVEGASATALALRKADAGHPKLESGLEVVVAGLFDDAHIQVRTVAARRLGEIGDRRVLGDMRRRLEVETHAAVIAAIQEALRKLEEELEPAPEPEREPEPA